MAGLGKFSDLPNLLMPAMNIYRRRYPDVIMALRMDYALDEIFLLITLAEGDKGVHGHSLISRHDFNMGTSHIAYRFEMVVDAAIKEITTPDLANQDDLAKEYDEIFEGQAIMDGLRGNIAAK